MAERSTDKPSWPEVAPYRALALQLTARAVNRLGAAKAREAIRSSIARVAAQVKASCNFIGPDCRLVVLPEYFLTGFPMGEGVAEWQAKACLQPDGPEYEAIARIAADNRIFLCGNAYECDPHFPDLFFQACFVFDPSGSLILRYRRLNSLYTATPHDVLDRYLDMYGRDALFPVARTELGNLACIASEEILYPEIARCLALRGAEVFLHPTSEIGSLIPSQKNIAKLARATENLAYVVSANSAGITDCDIPAQSTDGHSQVVNYAGSRMCEAGFGESMAACAPIHIQALRQYRARPGMPNLLSRQRNELFAAEYARPVYPANSLSEAAPGRAQFLRTQQSAIDTLRDRGVIP
jgi:predicted amidohydrolase